MKRIRKDYMFSEENLKYIQTVKEEKNLKYPSEALDLIIREHRENTDFIYKGLAKFLAEEISNEFKNELKKIRLASNSTDKNTQIILEMLNGLFIKDDIGDIFTSREELSKGLNIARNFVEDKINNQMKKKLYKEY
ncbi:hypothetical protein K5V21_12605 [Clostridium sardiniense]|uniref:Uncharacterized protein n=1 Tax=Clostridium sardiniense TaxID=29369 RepID=A0ABS7L0A2_CLOSR|nr:hypothetical protein [Clostridium sardiniense]MBY0756288.1 hypothetical protein [Clostridium sardiniense]MDQ0458497.1 hypothetical protein [Clostridium sardiniense]